MKLFEITIDNNLTGYDWNWDAKLIVANSEEEAKIRGESWMKDVYPYSYREPSCYVRELSVIDGFNIIVERPRKL